MNWKTYVALFLGFVLGFLAFGTMASLIDAVKAGKRKRSAANAMVVSDALEAFRQDHGQYPPLPPDSLQLAQYLVPRYLRFMPEDMAPRPYLVVMHGSVAAVISIGDRFIVERGKVTCGWDGDSLCAKAVR